jgi:leucyl/phenylalanyl-tRNA--protein transferase
MFLTGRLYGIAIGDLFAGESMFHHQRDASKVALVGLVERLRAGGAGLLDVQWMTLHLASLGARDVRRDDYLLMLGEALRRPLPAVFTETDRPEGDLCASDRP